MTNFEKLILLSDVFFKNYEGGGELIITINGHKCNYDTIIDYISTKYDIDEEEIECIKECEYQGRLVEIYFYNLSPNGFYSVFDSTLEGAARKMIEVVERNKDVNNVNFSGYKTVSDILYEVLKR
jgi:hypothetical protein